MSDKKKVQASWNGTVIAESDATLMIEGNHYFPPSSVKKNFFKPSETTTVCPWKGNASYYNVEVDGDTNQDAAWFYHEPKPSSFDVVGSDFSDYVAFWRGVEVKEA